MIVRLLRNGCSVRPLSHGCASALLLAAALGACTMPAATAPVPELLVIRGKTQTLRTYGVKGGNPVIVSSGDGGWMHLGPHIAATLAARGFFVVGFDVRAYLAGFTSARASVRLEDVPGDYRLLVEAAGHGSPNKPVLIGVSEGAGLSVLAAADPCIHALTAGVVGVGLPATNELGWRWRDSIVYLTHGVPNEPTFPTASIIGKVAPLPLALIRATRDEFVTPEDTQELLTRAADPKRLWTVSASNHRFSDNLAEFDARLIEALAWVRDRGAR